MAHLISAMLIALVAGASGCQAGSDTGGGRDTTIADCARGEACVTDGVAGRCSLRGHCVYPVPNETCVAGLRYASGACVPTEYSASCGCDDDGNECTDELCADGECVHATPDDRTYCAGGSCVGGVCCRGCWDGTSCQSGQDNAHCGSFGRACAACPPVGHPPDPCHRYRCTTWRCEPEPVNGPGCPHCGSLDELCCAASGCDTDLRCEPVFDCGEDCATWRCRPR